MPLDKAALAVEQTLQPRSNCGIGPLILSPEVDLPAVHVYNTQGSYVAMSCVTDDTANPDGMVSGIENLARVVANVVP